MQTRFSESQLAKPALQEANRILRNCVHCGFCTATCPTYVLLGDELDSPRGRIYLIKDMLENDRPASAKVVKHVDRCLSCLSCMTTCPSGVDYMHLVDQARIHIENSYRRPLFERVLRGLLAAVLPRPGLFRFALLGAKLVRPFAPLMPVRLKASLALVPETLPKPSPNLRPQIFPAQGSRRKRVALLTGCAQPVLAPDINEATIRLLTRHGCEVIVAEGAGCCGALTYHMGKRGSGLASARANIAAWSRELEGEGLDAVVIDASGCGTTVKDYGHMFQDDPDWAAPAQRIADLTKDVTELMYELDFEPAMDGPGLRVAYHSACSMQHGQGIKEQPRALLRAAGFEVLDVPEGHLCCGSAGTYNLLQPQLADRLRDRKTANIESLSPDLVATGNIGCITQIGSGTKIPIVHTVALLDWASGGPKPRAIV